MSDTTLARTARSRGQRWCLTLDSVYHAHLCLLSQYNQLGWWPLCSLACLAIVYMVTPPGCHRILLWTLATPQSEGGGGPSSHRGWWVMDRISSLLSGCPLMLSGLLARTLSCFSFPENRRKGRGYCEQVKLYVNVTFANIVSVFDCRVISEHEPPMVAWRDV